MDDMIRGLDDSQAVRVLTTFASPSFLLIFRQILNPFGVKALCKAKCYPNS